MKITLIFDLSFHLNSGIHVHDASNSHYGDLQEHGDLQMTLEVSYDLKFWLSDLNKLCSIVLLIFPEEEAKYHPLTRSALWRSLEKIDISLALAYI